MYVCCARVSTITVNLKSFGFLGTEMDLNKAYILLPIKISMFGTRLSVGTLFTSKKISTSSTKFFQSLPGVNSSIRPNYDGNTICGCAVSPAVSGILVATCRILQTNFNAEN